MGLLSNEIPEKTLQSVKKTFNFKFQWYVFDSEILSEKPQR